MSARTLPGVALVVLLVAAGCLGASGIGGPASDGATTRTTAGTTATTASPRQVVDCPEDRDRFREVAVEHVAEQTGTDPANVSVVNDAFVDYRILGECYYSAKVRNVESGEVVGVFVADNGSVVNRGAVETRAERVYERRYGNLSRALYRRIQSAGANERISVRVSVADINRTAAKRAVDRENRTGAEYREALSEEYERRAENKTQAVVAELRQIEGLTVESVGTLHIRVRATPEAIETAQRLPKVSRLDLRQVTTTYVSGDDA